MLNNDDTYSTSCDNVLSPPKPSYYNQRELKEIEEAVSCMSYSSTVIDDYFSKENCKSLKTESQIPDFHEQWKKFKNEFENLQKSLKISKADTEILVNAKQQLQLDLHESTNENKLLRTQIDQFICKIAELQSEAETNQTKQKLDQERSDVLKKLQCYEEKNEQIKELNEQVEGLKLDACHMKDKEEDLQRTINTLLLQKGDLKKEVSSYSEVNFSLESSLKQVTEANYSNKDYITSLRSDRDSYAAQLYESNQKLSTQQLALQNLHNRLVFSERKSADLRANADELRKRVMEKEVAMEQISSQLKTRNLEKSNLDRLIVRLNNDIHKVETEFTKIKREFSIKTASASTDKKKMSELAAANKELLEKLKVLDIEIRKKDEAVASKILEINQLQKQFEDLKAISCKSNSSYSEFHESEFLVKTESSVGKQVSASSLTHENSAVYVDEEANLHQRLQLLTAVNDNLKKENQGSCEEIRILKQRSAQQSRWVDVLLQDCTGLTDRLPDHTSPPTPDVVLLPNDEEDTEFNRKFQKLRVHVRSCLPSSSSSSSVCSEAAAGGGSEPAKLKAYKRTVKMLRKRLDDQQQQRATSSSSSSSSKLVQTDNPDVDFPAENENLLKRLEQQTADHQREMNEARRKRTLERAKSTKKLKETQEKLNESVMSGSQLQKTIHNLQIKEANRNKQMEIMEREKVRYRNKTRSLQASIRSITSRNDISSNHNGEVTRCDERVKEVDASVDEITRILATLKDNMCSLEMEVSESGDHLRHHKA